MRPADFAELSGHDAYDVLGVDPDATQDEIRRAYRSLAKTGHPDVVADARAKKAAEERIRLLNAARDVLQHRRAAYDAFRSTPPEPEPEPEEIIDDPWADATPGAPPPQDPWANADAGPPPSADPWDTADHGPPPPASPWGTSDPDPPPPPWGVTDHGPPPPSWDTSPPPAPPRPRFVRPARRRRSRFGIGCSVAWGVVWFGGALVLILSAFFPDRGPQPSVAVPAKFAGRWKGTVTDATTKNGTHQRWKAEVTLHAGKKNGEVRYLDGKCAGTAVPVSFEHDRLTVKTVFGSSMTGCDVGDMRLGRRKSAKLDVVYHDKNDKVTASGVLARQ
ncbi:DnaJ domain-containing protein [Actinoallomurus sp. CA-150999]|uniref:DnaJ domain-containing protein n=1 Tax=Actinoallomurus sp. CA-150999 TaxID=3239887 RepID=UPI003D8A9120